MTEEWRPVPGYSGYSASSDGRIKGRRGRVLKPQPRGGPTGQDYLAVWIGHSKREYVHILVCIAFHGPRPFRGAVVMHLDDDKTNCRASNLRWDTQGRNIVHRNESQKRRQYHTLDIEGAQKQADDIF
ncbi:MAG: NUMOD4 motif-containing HNH endonuclease [Nitrospiraceae bacterium]